PTTLSFLLPSRLPAFPLISSLSEIESLQMPPVTGTGTDWGLAALTTGHFTVVVAVAAEALPPPWTSGARVLFAEASTSAAPLAGTGLPLLSKAVTVCATPLAISPSGNERLTWTRTIAEEPSETPKLQGFFENEPQKAGVPGPPCGPK